MGVTASDLSLVFENIDHLAQLEMRQQGMPAGIVAKLYGIARGDEPIAFQAAKALLSEGGKTIACITGIVGGPLPVGEVDGPIGAAVLASGLCDLGRKADVVVPLPMFGVVESVRSALGGRFDIVEDVAAKASNYDAAVTIEKLGRNRKGVVHSVLGAVLGDQAATADDFIEQMNTSGKLTIGIGDGGNEIGFGAIYEEARKIVPRGSQCVCPCGDGIVTSTATRILYPAAVSNYGAYAITTAMGILEGRPLTLPSADRIGSAIENAVRNGCLDGGTF